MTLEEQARQLGNDPARLLARLKAAVAMLHSFREFYRGGRFDFEAKRLYTTDERACLEWRLRLNPEEPEGHENQQTNQGIVVLRILDRENAT
jgi:hypothetical protein